MYGFWNDFDQLNYIIFQQNEWFVIDNEFQVVTGKKITTSLNKNLICEILLLPKSRCKQVNKRIVNIPIVLGGEVSKIFIKRQFYIRRSTVDDKLNHNILVLEVSIIIVGQIRYILFHLAISSKINDRTADF